MSTHRFLRSLFLFLFLVLTFATLSTATADSSVNVLLITSDDLGIQTGCYGDTAARTPHLDALAGRGCLFENAYVAQASCSPSRSAMFTGLYPHSNGQYGLLNANVGFQLHPRAQSQTIPLLLKQDGYRTGILGKLHVGDEKQFPFDVRVRVDTRDVKAAAAEAGKFFRSSDGPFFFMANYADPHVQGRSPRPPREAFPTQYKGVPETPLKIGEVCSFPFQRLDVPEQIARTTQYYNAVTRLDAGIGLLLDELKSAGHADDTLILFVGDHGPPFFRGKTSCYEGGVHVPLLAVWPNVTKAGQRSSALVSTVDILPTILDAVGHQPQASVNVQGKSLRDAVTHDDFREYLATEFHYHGGKPFFPRRTIRDRQFKLIRNLRAGKAEPINSIDGDAALRLAREHADSVPAEVLQAFERAADPPEFELFDLESDPWEFHNLAEDSRFQAHLLRLQEALRKWQAQTNDPLLTQEDYETVAEFESRQPDPPRR
ncbi:MAG: sulfatase [Planctomycetaceae bacterium]|nr:sulfatase [Planctomycetaceae bacterium]